MVSFEGRRGQSWLRPAAMAALAVALLSAGCGGGGEATVGNESGKPDSYAVTHGETIKDCLIEVGVQFAVFPRDIAFFEKARKAGEVSEGGSAYDDMDKVEVRLLVSKQEGARGWMLWHSEPRSSSRSPEYAVHHLDTQGTAASAQPMFVAFKVKPKFSFRKEIRRCVRFPLSPP